MGEIKSTMDIIMEKTKGLTMTDEEKQQFKRREMEGKVMGLIQKFAEGSLDLERLKMEMAVLQEKDKAMVDGIVREKTMDRIELGEDNKPMLRILESIVNMDTKPIEKLLERYESQLSQEQEDRERQLRRQLEEQGISGSAVLPNLEADPEWEQRLTGMKQAFKEEALSSVSDSDKAK
jgi:predicted TIM-barrel fold metal-dependent hydrolase